MRKSKGYLQLAVATALAVVILDYVFIHKARSHDPDTHQANEFSKARNKANGLCCDGSDYTYVNPYSWERTEKGFRVFINKQWVDVPASAEVGNMRNTDGEAKVWLYIGDDGAPHVRCLMVGIES